MPMAREKFAERMIKLLRRAGFADDLRFEPGDFSLVGKDMRVYLSSAYGAYCKAGLFRRNRVIRIFLESALASKTTAVPEVFEEARPNLLPMIRSEAYVGD